VAVRRASSGHRRTAWGPLSRARWRFLSLYGSAPGPANVTIVLPVWLGRGCKGSLIPTVSADFNFYHRAPVDDPGRRVGEGLLHWSGLPQRFVEEDGTVLDIFQVLTPLADETQLYRQQLGVGGATGWLQRCSMSPNGVSPPFSSRISIRRLDSPRTEPWARNMMALAVGRGIPVWSGEDLYSFVSARTVQGSTSGSGTALGWA